MATLQTTPFHMRGFRRTLRHVIPGLRKDQG
jgi:hypothetical protein